MNRKLILRLLGAILAIEAIAMVPSLLISLYFQDGDSLVLGLCALGMLILGLLLWYVMKSPQGTHLRLREGFIVVALGWLVLSLGGALPFFFSGRYPRFEDAFFESVSGFTTTGATVLTEFEGFPRGIMFWRATTHWVGGMGVLVLTLALLPRLTGRTSHLVKAESPGPSLSKLVPHTGTTAKLLYLIYMALTGMEFLALLLCGLSPYDAAMHALSNAGTGGFSNYGSSVAAFQNPAAEAVITAFMFMFGVNFALYYRFLIAGPKDKIRSFFRDEEFRWYFGATVSFMVLLTLLNLSFYQGNWVSSFRYSAFEIASVFSTTGFATTNFNEWSVASQMLIFLAMWLGASAGSTAGGIKFIRILLLSKVARRSVRATGQPKKVQVIRLDGKAVDENMLNQIAIFAIVYITLVIAGGFLLSLEGKFSAMDNLSAALTCVSNVGPAFGALASDFAGYGIWGKLLCSFLMLAGRLELFPMLILFTKHAWTK
ncbi:MAG: TrkH family potassium uptake protein [Clostridia bacterium]|nr:TrkH family potassium uptake protein [Clostridia bacterium]